MEFRAHVPQSATVEIDELLSSMQLESIAPADRPYTIVNFVSSVDGRVTLGGRSGGLGDEGDRAIFHGLREQVDAVFAGTGTLRVERYGRILGGQERRERRVARGQRPEPLAVVITRTGQLPMDIPLFGEPEARVVVFSQTDVELAEAKAQVELVRLDPGELTMTTVMRRLRSSYDVRALLCEGGPTVFAALLHENLVDELFLTIAPKLAGGGVGPTITSGPELIEPPQLRLRWLLERADSLFLRYTLH